MNLTLPTDKSGGFLVRRPLRRILGLGVLHDFPKREFPCALRYIYSVQHFGDECNVFSANSTKAPYIPSPEGRGFTAHSIRLAGLIPDSITDGPGIRYVVFVQGCRHNCPGCHNPKTHDYAGGFDMPLKELYERIAHAYLISGVTFSGGEPFDKALPLTLLARAIHRKLHLPIICYTGYTLEELVQKARTRTDIRGLLTSIDTLIDGPFIQEKKSLDLEWRGSSNQRIISAAEIMTSLKA